ncbi:cornifelin homolog A-like [Sycon ciliatum]|uniref:cornifelin homolog A-like n=1 Tax=Sycon ciliatum TaxID=27933 RepID=UPI0020AE6D0B|eukprot:scpid92524/ scgid24005/ Cornifelin homolog A
MAKPVSSEYWSSGLFDFTDNVSICTFGLFCYPLLLDDTARNLGEKKCSCCAVPFCIPITCCLAHMATRTAIRNTYNIQGSIMSDMWSITCCPLCAACQEARQVRQPVPMVVTSQPATTAQMQRR